MSWRLRVGCKLLVGTNVYNYSLLLVLLTIWLFAIILNSNNISCCRPVSVSSWPGFLPGYPPRSSGLSSAPRWPSRTGPWSQSSWRPPGPTPSLWGVRTCPGNWSLVQPAEKHNVTVSSGTSGPTLLYWELDFAPAPACLATPPALYQV